MLCYLSIKNEMCNFFKNLFTAGVSIISEQPGQSAKGAYGNFWNFYEEH